MELPGGRRLKRNPFQHAVPRYMLMVESHAPYGILRMRPFLRDWRIVLHENPNDNPNILKIGCRDTAAPADGTVRIAQFGASIPAENVFYCDRNLPAW